MNVRTYSIHLPSGSGIQGQGLSNKTLVVWLYMQLFATLFKGMSQIRYGNPY